MKKKGLLVIIFLTFFFFYPKVKAAEYTIISNNSEQTVNDLNNLGVTVNSHIAEIGYIEAQGDVNIDQIKKLSNIQSIQNMADTSQNITTRVPSTYINQTIQLPQLFSYQWDMQKITNNGVSYSLSKGNRKNVTVALVDSGIDVDHNSFTGMIDSRSKNFVPAGGYENSENSETGNISDIDDKKGHGTAIAGQVAANGQIFGVSPGTNLLVYRVFGKSKSKECWILKAIIDATNNGANVINLSLGQYIKIPNGNIWESAEALGYKFAIDYATRHNAIVVTATGNDGLSEDNGEVKTYYNNQHSGQDTSQNYTVEDYPSVLPNTIAVGSSDNNNQRSSFSNYYNQSHSNFILAPGGGTSLLDKYGQKEWYNQKLFMKEQVLSTSNNGNYDYVDGTSISTGKVSGELAEIISNYHLQRNSPKARRILLNQVNYTKDGYKEISVYKALRGH